MIGFVCMVLANLGLILSNRSQARSIFATLNTPNPALWWITGGALGILALVLAIPLPAGTIQVCAAASLGSLAHCRGGAVKHPGG